MTHRTYDPALTRAHLSNRFLGSLIRYFTEQFGQDRVGAIVEEAGLSLEYLYDTTRWTSVEFDRRMCDAVAHQIAGLVDAPAYNHPLWQHWRRASLAMFARQEVMGPLWLLLWSFEQPSNFFANIGNLYTRGNRVTRMEVLAHHPGRTLVRARFDGPFRVDRPGTCWSRRGLFEAIPTIWGLPRATVVHAPHNCIHRAPRADHCMYEIRYRDRGEPDSVRELARVREHIRATLPRMLESMDRQYEEHREAQISQRKTAHYLPSHLVEAIRINPEAELVMGGGEHNEGAVLFADIVDFTTRCRLTPPGEIMAQLNLYYERIESIITAHGGIVDKRMGDGVMVVFIDPERAASLASLAACAVRCGLALLDMLPVIGAELDERGAAPFHVRVGVAAGVLVQGNLGARSRMEYTVVGETVNLAARLEAAAAADSVVCPPSCLEGVEPELYARGPTRELDVRGIGRVEVVSLRPAPDAARTMKPSDSSIMRLAEL